MNHTDTRVSYLIKQKRVEHRMICWGWSQKNENKVFDKHLADAGSILDTPYGPKAPPDQMLELRARIILLVLKICSGITAGVLHLNFFIEMLHII